MKVGIILCSRLDSERIPRKVLCKIGGKSVLQHLVSRLEFTGIPIILAVPDNQSFEYIQDLQGSNSRAIIYPSLNYSDPLARMNEAAKHYGIDTIIRVTHDKIFVDVEQMRDALEVFEKSKADYLYFPDIIPGTGFEIFSSCCILDASTKFKNVEHISYAARLVSKNTIRLNSSREHPSNRLNLLIDFPEDIQLHEMLLSQMPNKYTLSDVIKFFNQNPVLSNVNRSPLVTIYTCAANAAKFIDKAMLSVSAQSIFPNAEYILIDDHSDDTTCAQMAYFSINNPNVKWHRNEKNLGLASSSNLALKMARGKYIIRLDADDFFVGSNSIEEMIGFAQKTGIEALYPNNHFGEFNKIQKGSACHHVGGALFDKRAINFVKFTDGLRNYEGLDLFTRAKDRLKIGYFEKPIFFYVQHPTSMSKINLKERAETKRLIEEGICVSKI